MSSNTNVQITELDFNNIKTNFINYLRTQDTFKDYNFAGSSMSVLLDILAYNTQYNAYYLNMVANEMFLDSSLQRSSVISHAKLLNYTPKSAVAPSAIINFTANGVIPGTAFTLPKFSNFLSEPIDGVNYNFVNVEAITVDVGQSVNTVVLTNVELKQGIPTTYTFTVDSTVNSKYVFELPDSKIDTTTISVYVQQSITNTNYDVYKLSSNYLQLNSSSLVYFLQEGMTGKYEISFGDGILGKKLSDGNIVIVSYIVTDGLSSEGANNFVLMDSLTTMTSYTITPLIPSSKGGQKESISSIKYQAPKAFSSQNRAVTKEDYITILQQNSLGISFDAVNVWGGEENDPPVYGQIFLCLKPTGGYSLTALQKQRIINEIVKPVSVVTVSPQIIDPDYVYINIMADVYYDAYKTNMTSSQIKSGVKTSISTFAKNTLNSFNSSFSSYDLLSAIQNYNTSIISSDFSIKLQKKFYPNLSGKNTYKLYFNTQLEKGILNSGVTSFPGMSFRDPKNLDNIITGVYIEESPSLTNGIETITVLNPGYGYQETPTIEIIGDGTGATAHAIVSAGSIRSVVIDNPGTGYTAALAIVTPKANDTTGQSAALVVSLQGRYGTLRTYYNNTKNVKQILNSSAGTIDYSTGIVTLVDFSPYLIDNEFGQLAISAKPATNIISSSYNRIITVDDFDSNAITVNVKSKTSK
jgi:hypothetical protein